MVAVRRAGASVLLVVTATASASEYPMTLPTTDEGRSNAAPSAGLTIQYDRPATIEPAPAATVNEKSPTLAIVREAGSSVTAGDESETPAGDTKASVADTGRRGGANSTAAF